MTTYSLGFDIWAKDRASKEFDRLAGAVDKTDQKFGRLKAAVATGAAVAAGAIASFAVSGIDDAARLEMAWQRNDILFGEHGATIKAWAEGAAQNIGMSTEAALTAAGGFGNMFQQLGFTSDEAANMSTNVVDLVADLAAFNGLPTEQVLEGMSAAFRGEYDALQRVIPGISAARIETEALEMTGKKNADALTMQEKAAAVLAIVQNDGAMAAGYFADNQDKLAVRSQQSNAAFANLRAELGEMLLPVMTDLVGVAQQVLAWMTENPGKAKALAIAVGTLATGLLVLTTAQKAVTAAQWLMNSALLANPIGLVIVALGLLGAAFVILWTKSERFREVVTGALNKVKDAAIWLWENGLQPLGRIASDIFLTIANAAIGAYNNGVAPMMRWMLDAFATIARKFGDLLNALSKVPGFGWAADAADKMYGAADSADALRAKINNIPRLTTIDIVVNTTHKTFGNPYRGVGAIAMAGGGITQRGQLTLVGEEGPELWIPDSSGTVVPADVTARMLARGGPNALTGAGSRDDLDYLADRIREGFRASQREHARELLTIIRATGGGAR